MSDGTGDGTEPGGKLLPPADPRPQKRSRLKSFLRKLRRAMRLSPRQWGDLAVAVVALLRARVVFYRLSAKTLVTRLQGPGQKTAQPALPPDTQPDPETAAYLARLDWSIGVASNTLPWRGDCLIRCLAADRLLRRRGLVPEFRIGVRKTEDGALAAHAWIYCQGMPVAGGDGTGFEVLIGPQAG